MNSWCPSPSLLCSMNILGQFHPWCPCRDGGSLWGAVPLHPLPLLPWLRAGRAGTVSTQLGLQAPKPNPVHSPYHHHPCVGCSSPQVLPRGAQTHPAGANGDVSPHRLGPLYASARLLWLLVGLAVAGLLAHFLLLPSSPWALAWPLRLLNAW